jgi:hypothetical protein
MTMIIPDIEVQIEAISLSGNRPLVICDVDEVVVHFLRAFENCLHANDLWLDKVSFALNGNIRRKSDNEPIPVEELHLLLEDFFHAETATFEAIDGAVETLNGIADRAEIIFLTNLPGHYAIARRKNLDAHGLNAPVLINSGKKGPAVKRLTEIAKTPCIFIDDTPDHIASVIEYTPHVETVHFVHDPQFDRILEPIEGTGLRTGHWQETAIFLEDWLKLASTKPQ